MGYQDLLSSIPIYTPIDVSQQHGEVECGAFDDGFNILNRCDQHALFYADTPAHVHAIRVDDPIFSQTLDLKIRPQTYR